MTLNEHIKGLLKPHLDLINSTPGLLSLLYDADLLPEQCADVRDAISCASICEAYLLGQESSSCEIE